MQQINIGMIGGGTVGSGVFHHLQNNGALMESRLGVKLSLRKIAVKAFDEPRPYPIPQELMTLDWQEVVNDPQIEVVIELVGGTGIAKVMILTALKQGKSVITAKNKKSIQVSVYPALVPNTHVLASVNHVFNAVFVRGDAVGDTLFYGRGAGKDATASAVLSDVADAALDLKYSSRQRVPPFVPAEKNGIVLPMDEIISRYYLRLSVADKPGTLAKITGILAELKIGISSVIQPEGGAAESVPLILMTHNASNAAINQALAKIKKLPVIKGQPVMIRVENFE